MRSKRYRKADAGLLQRAGELGALDLRSACGARGSEGRADARERILEDSARVQGELLSEIPGRRQRSPPPDDDRGISDEKLALQKIDADFSYFRLARRLTNSLLQGSKGLVEVVPYLEERAVDPVPDLSASRVEESDR